MNILHKLGTAGTFRNIPTEQVIDEFAMYQEFIKEVAVQYFNKTCCRCGKTRIKQKRCIKHEFKIAWKKCK